MKPFPFRKIVRLSSHTRAAMKTMLLGVLALCGATAAFAADDSLKYPSPNGRFALGVTPVSGGDPGDAALAIVERASGNTVADLPGAYAKFVPKAKLVWSPDSRYVAFAEMEMKLGQTHVYFWDGAAFTEIEDLPGAPEVKITFRSYHPDEYAKNYGDFTLPKRWLKSNELLLSDETSVLQNGDSFNTSELFTIRFDTQHHAKLGKVVSKKATRE